MTEQAFPLTMFYQGWETYQQSLVETIAPLSSEQLALLVAPHHWSIGMVLNHMIGSRVFWFQRWLGEGDPSLVHCDQFSNLCARLLNWSQGLRRPGT